MSIVVFDEDLDRMRDTAGNFCCSSRNLQDIVVESIRFNGANNEFFDIKYRKERECHYRIPWTNEEVVAQILDNDLEPPTIPALNSENATLYGMLEIVEAKARNPKCKPRFDETLHIISPSGVILYDLKGDSDSRSSIERYCQSLDNRYVGVVNNWEDGDQREDPGITIMDLSRILPRWHESELEIALPFLIVQHLLRRLGRDGPDANDKGSSDVQLLQMVLVDETFLFQHILIYLCGDCLLLLKNKCKSRRA